MPSPTPSEGLSHVAMSVPEGTLTSGFRTEVAEFYGRHLGWADIESLRRPDRMTVAVGGGDHVNIRERPDPMTCSGYEHIGVLLSTPEAVEELWDVLAGVPEDVHLEALNGAGGDGPYRSFRFRYLLPLTIEVQHLP